MSGKPLGDRGEALAARYLEARGWKILDRKFRSGRREIDLVARRGEVVSFVEVKTRSGPAFGHPLESVTARKRREIERAALDWIDRHNPPDETVYRFDAVAIQAGRPGTESMVEHVEDAWRPDG